MNDTKQPEVLRPATACESEIQATVARDILMQEAATKLLRLNSLNQELLEALKDCLAKGSRWHPCDSVVVKAKAAIAKATGEQA